jgi:hypothetical protein
MQVLAPCDRRRNKYTCTSSCKLGGSRTGGLFGSETHITALLEMLESCLNPKATTYQKVLRTPHSSARDADITATSRNRSKAEKSMKSSRLSQNVNEFGRSSASEERAVIDENY